MKLSYKFFASFIFVFLISSISYAQISVNIKPISDKITLDKNIPIKTMPSFDVKKYLAEDEFESNFKDIPPRFGNPINVNFGYSNSGVTEVLADGTKIWRVEIVSKDAISINLIFDKFYLPGGTTLYVYNKNKSSVIGAFTDANNSPDKKFSTQPVMGDDIILEYNSPAYIKEKPEINISVVVHAYKNIFNFLKQKDYGQSGDCNRNVICPEGDPYRNQIRSAVMIMTSSNTRFCSGSLINNTRYDGTPYVLTADHCWDSSQPTWIVMFNYQAPSCPNPGGDGPTNMTISGTTLMAKNSYSDFCLVKLSSKPPASYNVYYNGWNHSYDRPTNGFCVHFPSCDVKKISFSTTPYTPTSYSIPIIPGDSSHWHVVWSSIPSTGLTPVTEGGSSGSPIYNQNKQIVGQLHGGPSSCSSTDKSDYFGRFCESWNRGTTSASRLRDWLDSANTGVLFVNGFDPNSGPLNAFNLQSPSAGTTIITIPGSGTPYTFNWDTASAGASYKWIFGTSLPTRLLTINVDTKPLTLTLGQLDTYIASLGIAQGASINGSWDVWAFRNNPPANDSLKTANGPRTVTFTRTIPILTAFNLSSPASGLSITTISGSTTPVNFNWTKSGNGGVTYKWLYKTGGSYADPATLRLASNNGGYDTVLSLTIGQLDTYLAGLGLGLGDSITGYWRVRAYTSTDSLNSTTPDRQITLRRALFSSLVVSGNLASTDSTFNRPKPTSGQSNIPPTTLSSFTTYYKKTAFKVSNTGHYYIYSGAGYDNFLVLYENGFIRTSPLTNGIGANDDTTGTWMPEFTGTLARSAINDINLVANVTYYLINTIYENSSFLGNWKDSIYGPGIIIQVPTAITTPYGNVIPVFYSLKQNYPNPFNPVTKISYDLPKAGLISLKVYDMLGREVITLVNEVKKEGSYIVDFDGSNLASGAYFFKLKADDFVDVKKMILLK
jgi:hypothetical protein